MRLEPASGSERLASFCPLRTELRTLDPAALAEVNRARGLDAAVAYRMAEEEGEEMERDHAGAELLSHLERWVTHPDERVVERLLGRHPLPQEHRLYLYLRASEEAAAEGLAWNPLLDRLQSNAQWPSGRGGIRLRERRYASLPVDAPPAVRKAESHLALATPWLRAQQSPESLRALRSLRSGALRQLLLREAGSLSEPVLETFARDPREWVCLAHNPAASPETATWLSGQMLVQLEALDFTPEGMERARQLLGAASTFGMLEARGLPTSSELPRACLERLEIFRRACVSYGMETLNDISALLVTTPHLRQEELHRFYDFFLPIQDEWRYTWLREMVRSPVAEESLWSRMAKDFSHDAHIRVALARYPKARWAPSVRSQLLRSQRVEVLAPLCLDASPGELARLLSRIAAREPRAAAEVLDSLPPERAREIPQGVVAKLLSSPSEALRLAALRLFGRNEPARGGEVSRQRRGR